jgi:hypothetical protein
VYAHGSHPDVPAGRWATPTAAGSEGSSLASVGAAPSPAAPLDMQSAATEANATPTEMQAKVGGGPEPAILPHPQSPPPTAERWQLGGAAELQPPTPVVTPTQNGLRAQGSPEVFSTPTAELQPPSPGDGDPDGHHGGSTAEDSLQPVPFGLDSPLAAHTSGVSSNSALSPAAASPDAARTDMLAAQVCTQKATPQGMLRISPLPDCRGGVPQRVRESAKPVVAHMACLLHLLSLCNSGSAIEA